MTRCYRKIKLELQTLKIIDMESKWYRINVLYMLLAVVVLIFNFFMIFFAAGYIDTIWKISDTMSKVLALGFVGLFVLNGVMLFRNYC